MLEKELLALQEKMRKLVEESSNKKKAKKKMKEKQKKQITTGVTPKVPPTPAYTAKTNNIADNTGEIINLRSFLYDFCRFHIL